MHNNGICSMDVSLSVYGEAGLSKSILLRVPRQSDRHFPVSKAFLFKTKWNY